MTKSKKVKWKDISFETFREPNSFTLHSLEQDKPSAFNGHVEIYKYKVTIERVEEPKEVLCERLQDLWDKCDNHHHWTPLENKAEEIGYEFKNNPGSKKNAKS